MRTFDYGFLKNQIPGQIVSISNVISDLNASQCIWKNLLFVINEPSRPRWEGKPDEGQR